MADRRTPHTQPRTGGLAALGGLVAAIPVAAGLIGSTAGAAVILVGPGQSIQAVIDDPATVHGDVIVVLPGVYQEQLDLRGKAISLQSTAPLDPQTVAQTVLDGAGGETVVTCATGEGPDTLLDGFTITGGDAVGGGGMWILAASPTVRNCTFLDNFALFEGGGILIDYLSYPAIVNCRFLGNTGSYGGAIANIMSGPSIVNCAFSGNAAYNGGSGGAIDNYYQSNALITGCTFHANTASYGGAVASMDSAPLLSNCVLWGDQSVLWGDEIANVGATPTVRYCDVAGSGGSAAWDPGLGADGGGNLDADPLFADPLGPDGLAGTGDEDLRLASGSPCIDAGDNTAVPPDVLTDLLGYPRFVDDPATPDTGLGQAPLIDMGAYELQAEGVLELELPLDIRPQKCPNKLNRRANGHLSVALAGTAQFDVYAVDLSTLALGRADGVGGLVAPRLGPPGPAPAYEDVTAPAAAPGECEALGPDGVLDLFMKFRIRALVDELELGDLPAGASIELVLYGALLDGTPFTAMDWAKLTNTTGSPARRGKRR